MFLLQFSWLTSFVLFLLSILIIAYLIKSTMKCKLQKKQKKPRQRRGVAGAYEGEFMMNYLIYL
jgi:hypothetical protein